jgi:transposase
MRPQGTKQELETRRLQVVALRESGASRLAVATTLGLTPDSVGRIYQRWKAGGRQALKPKRHPGSKSKLTAGQKRELVGILLAGAVASGFPDPTWSCSRVNEVIRKRFAKSYTLSHMTRLLKELGFSFQKPAKQARERNEAAVAAFRGSWSYIKNG